MDYLKQILAHCEVEHEAAADLSPEDFAMLRKKGLGASDVSIFLGTMGAFGKTIDSLITDKLTMRYTDQDRAISEKPSVRIGKDLEDMVLAKAAGSLGKPVVKAKEMFRMIKYPYLTMNLDGVTSIPETFGVDPLVQTMWIPVEAKVVTTFGDKYYDWEKASRMFHDERAFEGRPNDALARQHYIDLVAADVGIPPYYYVQVQHELLGMGAKYGYLAALRIKDWQIHIFAVTANPMIQSWIITEGFAVWSRIEKLRGMGKG